MRWLQRWQAILLSLAGGNVGRQTVPMEGFKKESAFWSNLFPYACLESTPGHVLGRGVFPLSPSCSKPSYPGTLFATSASPGTVPGT